MLEALFTFDRGEEVSAGYPLHAQAARHMHRSSVFAVDTSNDPLYAHCFEAGVHQAPQRLSHIAASLVERVERVGYLARTRNGIEVVCANGADELGGFAQLHPQQQVIDFRAGELGGYPRLRLLRLAVGMPIQKLTDLWLRSVLKHIGSVIQPQRTQDEPVGSKPRTLE